MPSWPSEHICVLNCVQLCPCLFSSLGFLRKGVICYYLGAQEMFGGVWKSFVQMALESQNSTKKLQTTGNDLVGPRTFTSASLPDGQVSGRLGVLYPGWGNPSRATLKWLGCCTSKVLCAVCFHQASCAELRKHKEGA